jgi:hypothetical protein
MKTPGLWKGGEAKGAMPAMGAKLEIEEIERRETGENSQTPGCLAYNGRFRVIEPPEYKGRFVGEFFTIGTKDDKRGKRDETWNRPEHGPGRLLKLLRVAGVANSDDDEEWMEAAVGCPLLAHVTTEIDKRNGSKQNRIGMFFEEGDPDFVGVGEELEAAANGRGPKKARGARSAAPKDDDEDDRKSARGKDKDDDDDRPARSARKRDDDDDDDRKPARSAKGKKDDDDDEPPPRSRRRRDDDD